MSGYLASTRGIRTVVPYATIDIAKIIVRYNSRVQWSGRFCRPFFCDTLKKIERRRTILEQPQTPPESAKEELSAKRPDTPADSFCICQRRQPIPSPSYNSNHTTPLGARSGLVGGLGRLGRRNEILRNGPAFSFFYRCRCSFQHEYTVKIMPSTSYPGHHLTRGSGEGAKKAASRRGW